MREMWTHLDMKQTLLIIDMQDEFDTARVPRVIKACRRELQAAIKRSDCILFVEYGSYTPTLPQLTSLVKGYDKAFFCNKPTDNGSEQVNAAVWRYNLPLNFRVCGVNANCCVWETVFGLRGLMPGDTPFVVVADAVNAEDGRGGYNELYAIRFLLDHLGEWKASDFPVVNERNLRRRLNRLKMAA